MKTHWYTLIALTSNFNYLVDSMNFVNIPSLPIVPEDAKLNFTELALKHGYRADEHRVITEDGFILSLFHIPGNKQKPVLLMPGILDSADTFILRGRHSLAAVLADHGYDVWLGNVRGVKYSRRHQRLQPSDKKFWDFSFHEMGVYDLAAFIDFILNANDEKQLSLAGHSHGNTIFYVLGAMKPNYNNKVKIAIALAPVCFLNRDNYQFPMTVAIDIAPLFNQVLLSLNQEEIFGDSSAMINFRNNVCTQVVVGYKLCAETIISEIAGNDIDQLEPEFFYKLMGHFPTSSSRKSVNHLVQLSTRTEFAQYDYGEERNVKVYGAKLPPVYDLSKVTMRVALLAGKNDKLAPLENVALLRDRLPNVWYHEMEGKKFNHADFIWGRNMFEYLFPIIQDLLIKYADD